MLARLKRFFTSSISRRSYDGAAGGRRWRGAGEMRQPFAASLAARGPLSARARYLCANNALASAGAEAWTSALVGTGIRPTSTHPDSAFRTAAASSWESWTDRADLDEAGDLYALQALAAKRLVVDGEAFAVMSHADDGELRVRLIDAEQVDATITRELGGGARIVAGVEFDAAGRRVAYYILRDRPGLPLMSALDAVRVPAADVIHLMRPEIPGQVRGVSWLAPIILRLRELDEAHDAQIVRQKIAAMLSAFVVDPDGSHGGFDGENDSRGNLEGGLEPGTIKFLNPGQDVRFSDPARVGVEVIEFLRVTAKEIAAGLGVPASVITGDFADANYSSLRAELVAFRRRVEAMQHNIIVFQMCRPIWRCFITSEILAGRLAAPAFEQHAERYLAARWITPRNDWVDPAKDVSAEVEAIRNGLMSRRQAVEGRGISVEELDDEIAADREREAALGLSFNSSGNKT